MEDNGDLRIYDAIGDLVEYLNSCGRVAFSGDGVRKVDIDEAMDYITEINISLPDDIRRAQAILDNTRSITESAADQAKKVREQAEVAAQSIIESAKAEAKKITDDANRKHQELINEHAVTKAAEEQAAEYLEQTRAYCVDMYEKARTDVSVLLSEAESCVRKCMKEIRSERDRIAVRSASTRHEDTPADEYEQPEEAPERNEPVEDERPDEDYDEPTPAQKSQPKPGKKNFIDQFTKIFFSEADDDDSWDGDDGDLDSDDETF